MNLHLPRPLLTLANLAWLAGFMLVFWAPFWSGARLPSLLLFVLGVVFHVRQKRLIFDSVPERRWGTLILLLFVPCLLSSFRSLDPEASFTVCLVLLLHYWVGLALLYGLKDGRHVSMAWAIGLTLLFWTFDGVIQIVFGRDLFGVELDPTSMRITGPFGDNLHMGLFISVMMPLLLWSLVRYQPWFALALFLLMSTVAFLSGARTNLVFTSLVALLLLHRLPKLKHRFSLLALCAAPLLVVPLSPVLQERVLQRDYLSALTMVDRVKESSQFNKVNHLLSGRLWIWETSINMLQDRPFLGIGPGAFDDVYSQYSHRPDDPYKVANETGNHAYHAHQMYVGMAAEGGLVGLAGLLVAIGLIGHWFLKAGVSSRYGATPYLICLVVIAFPVNSQPVLFLGWWFPIVVLLQCGFLAALEEQSARA